VTVWAAALVLLAAAMAGCSDGSPASSSSQPAPSGTASPSATTPPPPSPGDLFLDAEPTAVRYVRDVALGRVRAARRVVVSPPGSPERRTLSQLGSWLADIPVARIDAQAVHVPLPPGYPKDAVGVGLELRARLSPRALTGWVLLGRRVLVLVREHGEWGVSSDATGDHRLAIARRGLALFAHPRFLVGRRVTVVYGIDSAKAIARGILDSAEAAMPGLVRSYGGGPAAARPLIFLVKDHDQGERLAGVRIGQKAPVGTLAGDFAYIFLEQFSPVDAVGRASAVVALMTMLATREMLKDVPTSLSYGVATFEEDRYLATRAFILPLDDIGRAYPRYPSLTRWQTTTSLWGLSGRAAQLASQDALAMVHVIVTRHGGVRALRRLGAAFRSQSAGDFTAAQVQKAFRDGLGVSFRAVRAQAQAYVASGDWKYH
jgi:hypothetical protein